MSYGPVAEQVEAANEQHYEVPSEFFELFLGPRRKYSSAIWSKGQTSLTAAEEEMLGLTCTRAGLKNGMRILELGCGWGSLSLWMAAHYPTREITVDLELGHPESDDRPRGRTPRARQPDRDHRRRQRLRTGPRPRRLRPGRLGRDVRAHAELEGTDAADRAPGSKPDGRLFVHIFTHRTLAYRFAGTWASERFFTAGTMPSHDLMLHFQDDLELEDRWAMSGIHYAKTLAAWLERLDAHQEEALRILETVYDKKAAKRALGTWRLFLISTEQIWLWNGGNDWMVSHYLFSPKG